jgi:hypothetical protein
MNPNSKESNKSEQRPIGTNSTAGFLNDNVFITLLSSNGKDKISAIVNSSGYSDMTIEDGIIGKSYTYNSNNIYEIRIMRIYESGSMFLVKIK